MLFSNGYRANDVPIYTGEYVNSGGHVIIADYSADYIIFKIANENDTWDVANLINSDLVDITLVNKQKYIDVNNVLSSEKQKTNNFRTLDCGEIKPNTFFRGSEDALEQDMSSNNISYVINIDGSCSNISCDSLDLSSINIKNNECNSKIISSFFKIAKNHKDQKIGIYCSNPCNTTAYYLAIFESLAGYSYNEVVSDYMQSLYNCFGIDSFSDSQYSKVKEYTIDAFLHQFTKTDLFYDMSKCDMQYCAQRYLRNCQVSTNDVDLITSGICS